MTDIISIHNYLFQSRNNYKKTFVISISSPKKLHNYDTTENGGTSNTQIRQRHEYKGRY